MKEGWNADEYCYQAYEKIEGRPPKNNQGEKPHLALHPSEAHLSI